MSMRNSEIPNSMSETPKELENLELKVRNGEMRAIDAAYKTVATGEYLLIGTARDDVAVHAPPDISTYYDLQLRIWVYTDELKAHVLRATDNPTHAVMCALFGDYNERGQRE